MSEQFSYKSDSFDGPLETLLNLIEERKLSVSEISLAEVTDSYLAYVEKLPELPLGETSQFILIASTLLLIKSRTLLPGIELSSDERESVEELERRLARYAIVRSAAKLLRKEWGRAPLSFPKRPPARSPVFSPAESSLSTVAAAMQRLLNVLPKPESLAEAAVKPVLALEEALVHVKQRLSSAIRASFREFVRSKSRDEVIVYFLATLELVRSGSASVTQEKLFEDIEIEMESIAAPKYGT